MDGKVYIHLLKSITYRNNKLKRINYGNSAKAIDGVLTRFERGGICFRRSARSENLKLSAKAYRYRQLKVCRYDLKGGDVFIIFSADIACRRIN